MARRLLPRIAIVLAWLCSSGLHAQAAPAPPAWLAGAALQERLAQPSAEVYWSGLPLRQALSRFSRAARVAILVDRRIDPGQKVDLSLSTMPLREALDQIAEHLDVGMSLPGALVYYGPAEVASRLWTLAELRREEARRLPASAGRKFLQAERLAWPDFATPRDLLTQLASQSGIELLGLEQVPHDLWAAADLPAIPLVDRLTLIAVQFDLTFRIADSGDRVTLVPVPDDVAIVRSYPAGREPEALAALRRALALRPETSDACLEIGNNLKALGAY